MRAGLDYVREHSVNRMLFVEKRVDISPWAGEDEFGTSDVGIVDVVERLIIVFDWKFGAGVPVGATWSDSYHEWGLRDSLFEHASIFYEPNLDAFSNLPNEQLALYALGFWNSIAWKLLGSPEGVRVRLVIEQPRAPGGGGTYELALEDLLAFGEWLKARQEAGRAPDAPRTPGEKQCKFCKARKTKTGCYAHNDFMADIMGLSFDEMDDAADLDIAMPVVSESDLTPERRAYIARNKSMIEEWLKVIHAHVYNDALRGEPTPGLKLIAGRNPARKYVAESEEPVAKVLEERARRQSV
jgi:hypothetical protein